IPQEAIAKSGAKLEISPDGSVLASGVNKSTDDYQLKLHSTLKKISALRVELLTDSSLSQKGPARNNNLVLNEIILNSMGMDGSEGSAKNGQFVRIELPGKDRILHLAEVQAFVGQQNIGL
ncbi:MAG: hypothetical protein ACKVG9_13730, partial [Rhodospirillales bacterium]